MASLKRSELDKNGPTNHGLSLNHPKLESYNSMTDDNNPNLSPSKSGDQARKKTFKIISVKKGAGEVTTDNDADSIDGLDESQTEDLSSDFYDSSRATDLDTDLQDCINLPLTPDDLTTTTTIVVKQKPDQNSQSRFKVVKIETKEPFRRGKWVCYDFFDTAPASVVMVAKNGSKLTEESILHSALSDNFSSSTSMHYVQDIVDSSSNIFIPPVVPLSPRPDGHHPIFSDVFVPIQPAPASQVLNQLDGLTSDVMAPFIAQQVLMSVAGMPPSSSTSFAGMPPSSSTSFHNLAQAGHAPSASGHGHMIQNMPHTSVYPFSQNGPSASGFSYSGHTQPSQVINLSSDIRPMTSTNGAPTQTPGSITDKIIHGQDSIRVPGASVPYPSSHTQLVKDTAVAQGYPGTPDHGPGPSKLGTQSLAEPGINGADKEDQMGPGMDESTRTLQNEEDGLKEAVEAVGEMYMGLEDDADVSGGSTVAIDNKIEQAMDLVKRHLMYAVREEVEILKQQIGEMMERIGQLEYENTVLRSEAKPETLSKLQQPPVTQSAQTALSTQPAAVVVVSPASQQPAAAASQPAGAQQQQQQQQQAVGSQLGQPPSTT